MVKSCISDLIHLSVSLNDVAVDDGVSRQEPVLEVLLAEHRRQVVSAQELKAEVTWTFVSHFRSRICFLTLLRRLQASGMSEALSCRRPFVLVSSGNLKHDLVISQV